jgi:hypothetical protein
MGDKVDFRIFINREMSNQYSEYQLVKIKYEGNHKN